jgi:hypothetical protein
MGCFKLNPYPDKQVKKNLVVLQKEDRENFLFSSKKSLRPYNYAFNDPIYWNDPNGDCPLCDWVDDNFDNLWSDTPSNGGGAWLDGVISFYTFDELFREEKEAVRGELETYTYFNNDRWVTRKHRKVTYVPKWVLKDNTLLGKPSSASSGNGNSFDKFGNHKGLTASLEGGDWLDDQNGSRPDDDGYLTIDEIYKHFRTGNGKSLHTTLDQIDLSKIKASDFPEGIGSIKAFNLLGNKRSNINEGMVFGNIELQLINENTVQVHRRDGGGLPFDVYDFDVKTPWNENNYQRNILTIIGGIVHGQGIGNTKPFIIWIYGTAKIRK